MSSYIHGTDPTEQARLSKLNELINARCIALMPVKAGDKILDIGSGLGQFTHQLAQLTGPSGTCLGIERDLNQLAVAGQLSKKCPWLEFRLANAESLELHEEEWGLFDGAHARFILEHVQQPNKIIQSMFRAVRPGGWAVVADDDHPGLVLFPEPAGFQSLWKAYMQSYERLGNDPNIGRKLVTMLYHEGFRQIRNDVVFFGDSAGTKTFKSLALNLIGIITGARGVMIRERLIAEAEFDASISYLRVWSGLPDAAMWYTINWAIGFRPAT
ncbi:MAG TPA: methyltransferase domain-containing protein [Cyclobacteriaceae bacterium]|nr:methyltransferase domain-containing protein [Cyclobacteriaceae bacterium]